MHAGVVFSDYCSWSLGSFLSSSFIFFCLCARTHARLFPLSHPWLMSLVYRVRTKRQCCNRVKLVFVSFSLSLSLNLSIMVFFLKKKDFEFLDNTVTKLPQIALIIHSEEYVTWWWFLYFYKTSKHFAII